MSESKTFPCKYTVIEPGPIRVPDLVSLTWVSVTLKADIEQGPTYSSLKALLGSLFPGADTEHVVVNSYNGPSDIFVDDRGVHKGLPINDLATAIYWTASKMHELAALTPSKYEVDEDHPVAKQLTLDAFKAAIREMETNDATPRVHGRAVLFDRRVWF